MQVFISYRRMSWPLAQSLREKLMQKIDAQVFIDLHGVDEANFENSILRNLRTSAIMLLVISEYTFTERIYDANDWVRREIREALQHRIPIILVMMEGRTPPSNLPPDIAGVAQMQGVKFYAEFFDAAVDQLAQFITRVQPNIRLLTAAPTPVYPYNQQGGYTGRAAESAPASQRQPQTLTPSTAHRQSSRQRRSTTGTVVGVGCGLAVATFFAIVAVLAVLIFVNVLSSLNGRNPDILLTASSTTSPQNQNTSDDASSAGGGIALVETGALYSCSNSAADSYFTLSNQSSQSVQLYWFWANSDWREIQFPMQPGGADCFPINLAGIGRYRVCVDGNTAICHEFEVTMNPTGYTVSDE